MPINDVQLYYIAISSLERKLENGDLTEYEIYNVNVEISAYKSLIEKYYKHRKKEQFYSDIIFFGLFQVPQ